MKASINCIEMIKHFEGVRLKAYKPVPTEKYWTIGYGHYGADVAAGMVITQAMAENYLRSDLAKFEANVNKYDSVYHWNQNEFDALVSFAYNLGSIDQLVNNGMRGKAEIADKMIQYTKAGGKVLSGLVRRRQAERNLFVKGIVSADPVVVERQTIKKGSRGEAVREWQTYLFSLGYLLLTDGIFGKMTEMCTKDYQNKNGLDADGIVGSKTWKSMQK